MMKHGIQTELEQSVYPEWGRVTIPGRPEGRVDNWAAEVWDPFCLKCNFYLF